MIANQELNKKVRALTGETTPCDVNGNPCRDYAGDISEAMRLVDEMVAAGNNININLVTSASSPYGLCCLVGVDCGDYHGEQFEFDDTAPRAICLAYIAWKERTNEKINR